MRRLLLVAEARSVGGAEVYVERLARSLHGWEVCVAAPRAAGLETWVEGLEAKGIPTRRYDSGMTGWRRLGREAAAFDLTHVNLPSTYDGGAGLLPWLLARGGGHPVVVTEHLTRIPRSRRREAMKRITGSAPAAVIAVSRSSAEHLAARGLFRDRVHVVPNGVPDPGAVPGWPGGSALRVGVLASLEPRKGLDHLLEVVAEVGEVEVEIAGEGRERSRLEGLAHTRGIADRVRFLGRVADPYDFAGRQHLLALPSRLEAMPLAVLEAMAVGRGALVSALPGIEEIVRDGVTGRLLPVDDRQAWVRALLALREDRRQVRTLGEAARRRFEERFTLALSVSRTVEVYAGALGGR